METGRRNTTTAAQMWRWLRHEASCRIINLTDMHSSWAITGDDEYGAPIYGRGVSGLDLDGALGQFRQVGYHRGL